MKSGIDTNNSFECTLGFEKVRTVLYYNSFYIGKRRKQIALNKLSDDMTEKVFEINNIFKTVRDMVNLDGIYAGMTKYIDLDKKHPLVEKNDLKKDQVYDILNFAQETLFNIKNNIISEIDNDSPIEKIEYSCALLSRIHEKVIEDFSPKADKYKDIIEKFPTWFTRRSELGAARKGYFKSQTELSKSLFLIAFQLIDLNFKLELTKYAGYEEIRSFSPSKKEKIISYLVEPYNQLTDVLGGNASTWYQNDEIPSAKTYIYGRQRKIKKDIYPEKYGKENK